MKFPNIVYRCPGPHQCPGGTFDYLGVNSEVDHKAAKKDGWFDTLPEAIAGEEAVVVDLPDDEPTRKELEQKAKELDIKFDKKTTDAQLSRKIAEALVV